MSGSRNWDSAFVPSRPGRICEVRILVNFNPGLRTAKKRIAMVSANQNVARDNEEREETRINVPFSEWKADSANLDFHQASSHLKQKGPGYYLILLRNEIKHRSLRDKPTIVG